MSSNFDYKSLETFLQAIKDILNLARFRGTINNAITKQYTGAIEKLDSDLKLPINLVPSNKDLSLLQDYVNQNLQAAGDDISNALRAEIQRGILNGEGTKDLSKRVKFLFKEKKYQTRLKTIIRTETLRANNQGTLQGAIQAESTGLKLKKWLDVTEDARTSNICKQEHAKYGSKEQAIPLDDDFIVKADNKTIKSKSPPFHPNCRTVLRIVRL